MSTSQPLPPECAVPLVELEITDELDLANLSGVGGVLDRVLTLRPREVVVDLSGCRHIDAASVALLFDVHRRLARQQAVLTVRNPHRRIRRILDTAGLALVVPVVDTSDDARPSPEGGAPLPRRPRALGRAAVTGRGPEGDPAGGRRR